MKNALMVGFEFVWKAAWAVVILPFIIPAVSFAIGYFL
jgi:hypothetical protein